MTTIAENLQIIKDSTDAIKQAIIDKGGDVSGDITTWAGAISAIESGSSSGGSNEESYTFTGTISRGMDDCTVTGSFDKDPSEIGLVSYLLLLGSNPGGVRMASGVIIGIGPHALSLNVDEPIESSYKPAMAILRLGPVGGEYSVIPVNTVFE